jgi:hypothetical protein
VVLRDTYQENQQLQDDNQEPKNNKGINRAIGSLVYTAFGTGISYLALEKIIGSAQTGNESISGVDFQAPITKLFNNPTVDSVATRIVSPFTLVINKKGSENKQIKLTIPNSFNSANPSNPAEAAKQQAELTSNLQKQLSEQVGGTVNSTFGNKILSEGVTSKPSIYIIQNQKITASSSFEYGANGSKSVEIGSIDQQNLDLSNLRGQNVYNALQENLQANVLSQEVQPTQAEYNQILDTGKSLGFSGSNNEIVLNVTKLINENQIPSTVSGEQMKALQQIKINLNQARNVTIEANIHVDTMSKDVIAIPVGVLAMIPLAITASRLILPKRTPRTIRHAETETVVEPVPTYQIETIVPLSQDRLLNDYMGQYRGFLQRLLGTRASNEGVVSEGLDLQAIIQNRVPQINRECNNRFATEEERNTILNNLVDELANEIRMQLNLFKATRNSAERSPRMSDSEDRTYDHNVGVEGNLLEIEKVEVAQCRERAEQIINQIIQERRLWNRFSRAVRLQSMRRDVSTAFSQNRNVR